MKLRRHVPVMILAVSALFLWACAGPKVDEKKPLAEIETEAEKMTADDLQRMAGAYRKAILKKRGEVDDLADALEDVEPAELTSGEVEKLKTSADALATSVAALTERFDLYISLLKQKDGDISGLNLD